MDAPPRAHRRRRAGARRCWRSLGTGWDFEPVPPRDAGCGRRAKPASREAVRLAGERERLQAALERRVPRGPWIVIDQTHNRLRLMRGDEIAARGPLLGRLGHGAQGRRRTGRVWVFDTPRGRFEVLSKTENPVWKKPDWAFVEEGEPIPKDPADRLEYGSLGEYALYFGNGYMIHGTLYERLLGRPVSHGCIRLGREPLRLVYRHGAARHAGLHLLMRATSAGIARRSPSRWRSPRAAARRPKRSRTLDPATRSLQREVAQLRRERELSAGKSFYLRLDAVPTSASR